MPPSNPFKGNASSPVAGGSPPTALGNLGGFLKNIISDVNSLKFSLGSLGEAIKKITADVVGGVATLKTPFTALQTVITAMTNEVGRFVQLASPGVFKLFQLALDDLYASIGKSLIPAMQQFTAILRSVGGALFNLTSDGQKVIQAIFAGTVAMVAFTAATLVMQTVLTAGLGPLLAAIIGGISGVVLSMGGFQKIVAQVSSAFGSFVEVLGKALVELAKTGIVETAFSVVAQVFKTFAQAFGAVVSALAPGLTVLVSVLQKLIPVIFDLVKAWLVLVGIVSAPIWAPLAAGLFLVVKAAELLGPMLKAAAAAFVSVWDLVTDLFVDLGASLVDFVSDLLGLDSAWSDFKSALNEVQAHVIAFVQVLRDMVQDVVSWVRDLFGLQSLVSKSVQASAAGAGAGIAGVLGKDNTGAAARSVSTGSVENVLQTARERAFQLGSGANKPEERTATAADSIATRAAEIKTQIDSYIEWLKTEAAGEFAQAAWDKFAQEYPDVSTAIQAIINIVKNPGGAIKDAGEAAKDAVLDSANAFNEWDKRNLGGFLGGFGNLITGT